MASLFFWRTFSPTTRILLSLALAVLLLCVGGRGLLDWSRALQPTALRQLEEPAAEFLRQTVGRSHLEVVQLQPLLVVASLNKPAPEAAILERSLNTLLAVDASAGEKLLLVRGPVPYYWSQFPLLCLTMVMIGTWLTRRGYRQLRAQRATNGASRRPLMACSQRRRQATWLGRSLWLIVAVALCFQQFPLALGALACQLGLRLRARRLEARPKNLLPILYGKQEAAIILMSYPPQESAQVLRLLGPEQASEITRQVTGLPEVRPELRQQLLDTFHYHLDRLCATSCRGLGGSCKPEHMAKTLVEFYLNSVVTGTHVLSHGSRLRRRIDQGPACTEGATGGEPVRLWGMAGRLGVLGVVVATGWLLQRHDPASQRAHQLQQELSRFVGARQIVTEVVQRGDRCGSAVALVGVSVDEAGTDLPLIYTTLARLGLDPGRLALVTVMPNHSRAALWLFLPLLAGGLLWRWRARRLPAPTAPLVAPAPEKSLSVSDLIKMDQITLEVGRGLLSLIDPKQGAQMLERAASIRSHIARELGLVLPSIRLRDNQQLRPQAYLIKVHDLEVGLGEVQVNHFLALGPEEKLRNLRGTQTVDPTYGRPGVWISPDQRGDAERLGCIILDPVSVMAAQLTELTRQHAPELLSYSAAHLLLQGDELQPLLHELEQRGVSEVIVWKVLRLLLAERVSIRNLQGILEAMLEGESRDPEELTERVRCALGPQIVREYLLNDGSLRVRTLPDDLDDEQVQQFLQSIQEQSLVVVAPASCRRRVGDLGRGIRGLVVLSRLEIPSRVLVREGLTP